MIFKREIKAQLQHHQLLCTSVSSLIFHASVLLCQSMKSVSPLSEKLSLSAANPHIPGEIAESTAMKFISHMAASVPPNHNLD